MHAMAITLFRWARTQNSLPSHFEEQERDTYFIPIVATSATRPSNESRMKIRKVRESSEVLLDHCPSRRRS
jgi:hypothetical protein